jgi:hypothetical protein
MQDKKSFKKLRSHDIVQNVPRSFLFQGKFMNVENSLIQMKVGNQKD